MAWDADGSDYEIDIPVADTARNITETEVEKWTQIKNFVDEAVAKINSMDAAITALDSGGVATSYTIRATNGLVLDNTHHVIEATAAITITLPTASGIQGREYRFINSSTGDLTIAADGSEEIGNEYEAGTLVVNPGNTAILISNGTATWRTFGPFVQGAFRMVVSDTAPTSPDDDDVWIDTSGV